MVQRLSGTTCALCGGHAFDTVLRFDAPDQYERAAGITEEGYFRAWVRCTACNFHQSQYSRPPTTLDRLYESSYRDIQASWRGGSTRAVFEKVIKLPAKESETHFRVDWIVNAIASLAQSGLIQWTPQQPRLLDIGGATGVFAYEFTRRDWSATVIDPASSGAFLPEYGVNYISAPYGAAPFPHPFDLVSQVFVLEHLTDPIGALAHCRKDLAPGGLIYVEVPDAAAFRLKPAEDDIFNACHLWMFEPVTLVTAMDRAGMEIMMLQRVRTRRGHLSLMALGKAKEAR